MSKASRQSKSDTGWRETRFCLIVLGVWGFGSIALGRWILVHYPGQSEIGVYVQGGIITAVPVIFFLMVGMLVGMWRRWFSPCSSDEAVPGSVSDKSIES